MIRAIGYIRRSKAAEANTVSLLEQERQIRQYCHDHNAELVDLITHDGVSGANRTRWLAITRAVQEHGASMVVAYHQDRLSRDTSGLLENLRALNAAGVAVHEVGVGLVDIVRPVSKLTVTMRAAFDEFYRDVIRDKTKGALAYRKATGQRWTRYAPFGHCWQGGQLVPEPEEARAVVLLQSAALLGLGVRDAYKYVRHHGYTGRLSRMTVWRCMQRVKSDQ